MKSKVLFAFSIMRKKYNFGLGMDGRDGEGRECLVERE
jgi:hypothetical protein